MPVLKLVKFAEGGSDADENTLTNIEHVYSVRNMTNFEFNLATPVVPAPLPEEKAEENVLLKLEGNTGKIALTWTLKDADVSPITNEAGNLQSPRKILEQMKFFIDDFAPEGLSDSYAFVIQQEEEDGTISNDITEDNSIIVRGTFQNTKFATEKNNPVIFQTTVNFIEGNVISAHDQDIPRPPNNITVTSELIPGSDPNDPLYDITVTWDRPTGVQNPSYMVSIVSAVRGSVHREGSATSPITFSDNPRGEYRVTVRARDGGITGEPGVKVFSIA